MKNSKLYYLFLLLPVLVACGGDSKIMNNRITLWRNDKIPYGTWYAYNNVKSIFPRAEIVINKRSPDKYRQFSVNRSSKSIDEDSKYDGLKTAYIIVSTQVYPDESEQTALFNQVNQGETIFISSPDISERLLDSLHLKTGYYSGYTRMDDSLKVSVLDPVTYEKYSYSYPGMALDNYFQEMDTTYTTVLGRDADGHANFVKFTYKSGGAMYIHLAPAALTNFFLLHKDNKSYYDNVFSHLPHNVQVVRWDDYFRYSHEGDDDGNSANSGFSAMSWVLKQPPLAAGLWLLLALLLLVYLFESKRKQRIIPVIEPLKNSSLDFVKTIGRLYFQRKDNKDLSYKMTAYFLDYVRNRYNIKASLHDEEFEQRLAYKSGYDPEAIKNMLYYLKFTNDQPVVSDEELLRLNMKLDNFYKHT